MALEHPAMEANTLPDAASGENREGYCESSNPDPFPVQECSVCFEVMGGACPVRRLACGHGFHHACIQRWLQNHSTCPLCKADTPMEAQTRSQFKVDLGHQEMQQIMSELEDIFIAVHGCAGPDRPVAVSGLSYNLCVSLGYEDEDELEEAIGGSLVDFMDALPQFTIVWPETDAQENAEQPQAIEARVTMRPEPTEEELSGPGSRTMFTVATREDLWRLVLQGPRCDVEIPEIEFAIRPKERRRVDTIYNMLAAAIFHLGDHVQKNRRAGGISDDEVSKICETMDRLNELLDVDQPFTFTLSDPQGVSELKPLEGAHVTTFAGDSITEESACEVACA